MSEPSPVRGSPDAKEPRDSREPNATDAGLPGDESRASVRRVRLIGTAIVAAHLLPMTALYFRDPPATAAFTDVWPDLLYQCFYGSLKTLLIVWAAFGGRWWVRWPLAFLAVTLLSVATVFAYSPQPIAGQRILPQLTDEMPPLIAPALVGTLLRWRGWRSIVARDDEHWERFSLREWLVAMFACSLLLVAIRWTAFNLPTLAALHRGLVDYGSMLNLLFRAYVLLPLIYTAAVATPIVVTAIGRPRPLSLVAGIALVYALGLAYWAAESIESDPEVAIWFGGAGAVEAAFIGASLLTLRRGGWRIERALRESA